MPLMRSAMTMRAARPGSPLLVEAGEADIQIQVRVEAALTL